MRKLKEPIKCLLLLGCVVCSAQTGTNYTSRLNIVTTTTASATNSFVSTGLVLPPIPPSGVAAGHCAIIWQSSSVSGTAQIGAQFSAAPTGSWFYAQTQSTALSQTATAITSTTQTAITATMTPSVITTSYVTYTDIVVNNGATSTTLTFYVKSSTGSVTITIQPGSYCAWL